MLDETLAGALEEEKQSSGCGCLVALNGVMALKLMYGFEIDGDVVYSEFGDRDRLLLLQLKNHHPSVRALLFTLW